MKLPKDRLSIINKFAEVSGTRSQAAGIAFKYFEPPLLAFGMTRAAIIRALGLTGPTYWRCVLTAKSNRPDLLQEIIDGRMTCSQVEKLLRAPGPARGPIGPRNEPARAKRLREIEKAAASGFRASQIAAALNIPEALVRKYARLAHIELPDKLIGKLQAASLERAIATTLDQVETFLSTLSVKGAPLEQLSAARLSEFADSADNSYRMLGRLRKAINKGLHISHKVISNETQISRNPKNTARTIEGVRPYSAATESSLCR